MPTEMKPSQREIRPQKATRLQTSRPNWSVPKRFAAEGGRSTCRGDIASGSWVTIHGARSAITDIRPRNATPMHADRLRASRGSRRRRSEERLAEADGGVEEGIEHIQQRVDGDVDDGGEEDHALDEREVLGEDRRH